MPIDLGTIPGNSGGVNRLIDLTDTPSGYMDEFQYLVAGAGDPRVKFVTPGYARLNTTGIQTIGSTSTPTEIILNDTVSISGSVSTDAFENKIVINEAGTYLISAGVEAVFRETLNTPGVAAFALVAVQSAGDIRIDMFRDEIEYLASGQRDYSSQNCTIISTDIPTNITLEWERTVGDYTSIINNRQLSVVKIGLQ